MNEDFFVGVSLVKHFYEDINSIIEKKSSKVDFEFYSKNFENLLFYLSKSFLSSNYDVLYPNLSDMVLNKAFRGDIKYVGRSKSDNPIYINKDNADGYLGYLLRKQYCSISEALLKDTRYAFRFLRNKISHFDYKIKDNIIYIESECYDLGILAHIYISVESFSLLLKDTIATYGQSKNKGAYDYIFGINHSDPKNPLLFKIQSLRDGNISPADIVTGMDDKLLLPGKQLEKCLRDTCNINGRYYVKKLYLDNDILSKAGLKGLSNRNDINLYMCALDEIKRASISYNKIVQLLYSLKNKDLKIFDEIDARMLPILSNTVFISYMSLVFDDNFIHDFDGIVNSNLFIEKTNIEDKMIPRKIRNSLMHSRYKFENIFDSSKNIVIEFWDENKNTRNFECRITKENAEQFIEYYLKNIERQ